MAIVSLEAADGHRCAAWRADPYGHARGGIVIVQEIFGVNDHIRSVADRWAEQGYAVLAPALFDRLEPGVELGYTPEDVVKGRALRTKLGNDLPLLDLAAAVRALPGTRKVAMVGFCWGGLLTWLAAGQLDGLACAVSYYGSGVTDRADRPVKCPVQLHFGERDDLVPVQGARAMAETRPDLEVHLYDADHGFSCDARASFDAAAHARAFHRARGFLMRHVG